MNLVDSLGLAEQDYREAVERVNELRDFRDNLIREAAALGIPKARIAREAGVSRATVHTILRNDK
jgi:DNA invertase Pin-like site-specific DNA recombinase